MRIGLIADDLTGANDSGVQFTRQGLKTVVLFDTGNWGFDQADVLVLETDSRSIAPDAAYQRVKKAAKYFREQAVEIIFKKIDSTLRGNLGAEIDAIYDEICPQLVIIAPGYPQTGRQVTDGYHYLNGQLLNRTELSNDPTCPVHDAYVPRLFQKQTNRDILHLRLEDLNRGFAYVKRCFAKAIEQT